MRRNPPCSGPDTCGTGFRWWCRNLLYIQNPWILFVWWVCQGPALPVFWLSVAWCPNDSLFAQHLIVLSKFASNFTTFTVSRQIEMSRKMSRTFLEKTSYIPRTHPFSQLDATASQKDCKREPRTLVMPIYADAMYINLLGLPSPKDRSRSARWYRKVS